MEVSKKAKVIKEIKSILLIVVVVFSFRSVFFEPFRIPSGSMIPTLMIGDFILVNKFSYGFKVPFSDINLFGFDSNPIYLFGESKPKRGDVIVFKYPKDKSVNYIKRVVGLPGDEIEIVDKRVFVNGKPINNKQIAGKEIMADMDDKFKRYRFRFLETQTGEHQHIVQQALNNSSLSNLAKIKVPEGKYFVMGDNRDFSFDSRFWGFVPHENVRGKAMFVWFSMIFPFGESPFKLRFHRIGTVID